MLLIAFPLICLSCKETIKIKLCTSVTTCITLAFGWRWVISKENGLFLQSWNRCLVLSGRRIRDGTLPVLHDVRERQAFVLLDSLQQEVLRVKVDHRV